MVEESGRNKTDILTGYRKEDEIYRYGFPSPTPGLVLNDTIRQMVCSTSLGRQSDSTRRVAKSFSETELHCFCFNPHGNETQQDGKGIVSLHPPPHLPPKTFSPSLQVSSLLGVLCRDEVTSLMTLKERLIRNPAFLSPEIRPFLKPEMRKSFDEQWKLFSQALA
jgi:hypothetical protein